MALVNKGEMANYWGQQPESSIFNTGDSNLDNVMRFTRFKKLRKAFCFRCPSSLTPAEIKADAAVRIRSLLNLIKVNGTKYVHVGREVAVDDASVACRSKFGRHLIMFNPTKPGGKYHFRFYMTCCSTSWIALNLRLHCASEMEHGLEGIETEDTARQIADDFHKAAKVCQHVLEVVLPFYYSKRIVNCDNYYTSVQLLEALRVKGLYGRGTVRRTSKHFPRHVITPDPEKPLVAVTENRGSTTSSAENAAAAQVERAQNRTVGAMTEEGEVLRGASRQGVSVEHKMLAASWCDGNIIKDLISGD